MNLFTGTHCVDSLAGPEPDSVWWQRQQPRPSRQLNLNSLPISTCLAAAEIIAVVVVVVLVVVLAVIFMVVVKTSGNLGSQN